MISLKVVGLRFSYRSAEVLKGVEFEIREGEVVSILGMNGAGKTTLLKTINLLLKPKEGVIYLDGKRIETLNRRERARLIGYVPQFSQRRPIKVFDAVLLGRRPYITWEASKGDLKRVEEVLHLLGLEHLAMREIRELSGGEFQKVMIARAIAQDPRVLLLDEPLSNLDLRNQMEMVKLIKDLTYQQGISTLVVMHDINIALRISNRFLMMREGRIEVAGREEVITQENIEKIYGVRVLVHKVPETEAKVVIPVC